MKESLSQYIEGYTRQPDAEKVQKGYKGLIEYLMNLRTHFINQYQTEFIIGSFYQGYMDISYFPITPKPLKNHKLKIGLVFNHEKMRFEIWLLGRNKQIQKKYWNWFNRNNWNKYKISKTAQTSIIVHVLVEKPDFSQINALTEKIENSSLKFIKDITDVLT